MCEPWLLCLASQCPQTPQRLSLSLPVPGTSLCLTVSPMVTWYPYSEVTVTPPYTWQRQGPAVRQPGQSPWHQRGGIGAQISLPCTHLHSAWGVC